MPKNMQIMEITCFHIGLSSYTSDWTHG